MPDVVRLQDCAPSGTFSSFIIPADDVVEIWQQGYLGRFNGIELTVRWLDDTESRRIRQDIFSGNR